MLQVMHQERQAGESGKPEGQGRVGRSQSPEKVLGCPLPLPTRQAACALQFRSSRAESRSSSAAEAWVGADSRVRRWGSNTTRGMWVPPRRSSRSSRRLAGKSPPSSTSKSCGSVARGARLKTSQAAEKLRDGAVVAGLSRLVRPGAFHREDRRVTPPSARISFCRGTIHRAPLRLSSGIRSFSVISRFESPVDSTGVLTPDPSGATRRFFFVREAHVEPRSRRIPACLPFIPVH